MASRKLFVTVICVLVKFVEILNFRCSGARGELPLSISLFSPGVHHKMKTLAELEADLHQSSPQKPSSPASVSASTTVVGSSGGTVGQEGGSGDMTAFNKLLFMMNAAPETNQNTVWSFFLFPLISIDLSVHWN